VSSFELAFQDFAEALWTADDEPALRAVGQRVASRLGFDAMAYLSLSEAGPILISDYPQRWIDRYFDRGYSRIDPVLRVARAQLQAFRWSGDRFTRSRSGSLHSFFAEAHDFGIMSGLTVPIYSGFGRFTTMNFVTERKASDVERTLEEAREVFELIGLYYHARIDTTLRAPSTRSEGSLTQRESQCLAWAARGKTKVETGEILGLTPRTVKFHLENARAKLEASNITQTVAIAVRDGLIP
jgi:LuxR family transcriptional activator of conjugal transfer of Ti plasmids